jgi:hypothetical protein
MTRSSWCCAIEARKTNATAETPRTQRQTQRREPQLEFILGVFLGDLCASAVAFFFQRHRNREGAKIAKTDAKEFS